MRATNDRVSLSLEEDPLRIVDRRADDDALWVAEWSARNVQKRWEGLLARVFECDLDDQPSPRPQLTLILGGRDVQRLASA
jgi:hypothetical protein